MRIKAGRNKGGCPFARQHMVGKIGAGHGWLNGNGAPIGTEFARDNLGQCSIDALPRLALRNPDDHVAILGYFQPRTKYMFALSRD